jgi:hypothetical protein
MYEYMGQNDMHTRVCTANFTETNAFEVDGGKRVILRWLLGKRFVRILAGLNCFIDVSQYFKFSDLLWMIHF